MIISSREFLQTLKESGDFQIYGSYEVIGDLILDLSEIKHDVFLYAGKLSGNITITSIRKNQVFDATECTIAKVNIICDSSKSHIILPQSTEISSDITFLESNEKEVASDLLGSVIEGNENLPPIRYINV